MAETHPGLVFLVGDRAYKLKKAHHGETVVLDASWSDDARRVDARRVAAETVSDLELRCVPPAAVVAARLAVRAATGGDASDADRDIAHAMLAVAQPWPASTAIDTVPKPRAVLEAALRHLTTTHGVRAADDAGPSDNEPPSRSQAQRVRESAEGDEDADL